MHHAGLALLQVTDADVRRIVPLAIPPVPALCVAGATATTVLAAAVAPAAIAAGGAAAPNAVIRILHADLLHPAGHLPALAAPTYCVLTALAHHQHFGAYKGGIVCLLCSLVAWLCG